MEDALRNAPKPKPQNTSFAERIFGARDEFHGVEIGFKNSAEVGPRNDATVVTVGAPTEIELELPAKPESPFQTFADTLLEAPQPVPSATSSAAPRPAPRTRGAA